MKTAFINIVSCALISGCAGYIPGEKAYWDSKIREMCEKDGGVTIYEQVRISKTDLERGVLPVGVDGKIGVTLKSLSHPDSPVYAERHSTDLHDGSPQISRAEWTILRRIDSRIVA